MDCSLSAALYLYTWRMWFPPKEGPETEHKLATHQKQDSRHML